MQGTMRHATGCVAGAVKGARHVDNPFRVSDHHCDALGKGIMTLLGGSPAGGETRRQGGAQPSLLTSSGADCANIERIYNGFWRS